MNTDRKELFELYKLAIDLDKYELDLGWKLVQFFTVLNSGLVSLGFTLLGSSQQSPKYYISAIFALAVIFSFIAIKSRERYHEHSLQADYKRTLIGDQLDLYERFEKHGYKDHTLAISTSLKSDPVKEILTDPKDHIRKSTKKFGTVPYYHKVIFAAFITIGIIGFVLAILNIRI